jgi:signal transduction histidine kinase
MVNLDKEDIELITHDLNNPLGALTANLNYLVNSMAHDPAGLDVVQDCLLSLIALGLMVDNLSVIARLGDGSPIRRTTRVSELLRKVEEEMKPLADTLSVGLKITHDPEIEWLNGEHRHLVLALENLVTIALNCAPEASTVSLSVLRVDENTIALKVLDDGPPLPPDLRPLIGDRRGQVALKNRGHGGRSGRSLGLYSTALVAASVGGSLEASEEGGRSSMALLLPGTPSQATAL